MPSVRIPPPYRGPTLGTAEIEVDAPTVGAALDEIERKYPGFLPQVLDDDGNVHRFVKLFKNGEHLVRDPLRTALGAGDDVEIIAAIAGG
jgi:molybdopterin converting factor small subunit